MRAVPLQSGHLQGPSDLWQALQDKPPKAVLHYTLTIRVDQLDEPEVLEPPPKEKVFHMGLDPELARAKKKPEDRGLQKP